MAEAKMRLCRVFASKISVAFEKANLRECAKKGAAFWAAPLDD
jgi:hypothetical protein